MTQLLLTRPARRPRLSHTAAMPTRELRSNNLHLLDTDDFALALERIIERELEPVGCSVLFASVKGIGAVTLERFELENYRYVVTEDGFLPGGFLVMRAAEHDGRLDRALVSLATHRAKVRHDDFDEELSGVQIAAPLSISLWWRSEWADEANEVPRPAD